MGWDLLPSFSSTRVRVSDRYIGVEGFSDDVYCTYAYVVQ